MCLHHVHESLNYSDRVSDMRLIPNKKQFLTLFRTFWRRAFSSLLLLNVCKFIYTTIFIIDWWWCSLESVWSSTRLNMPSQCEFLRVFFSWAGDGNNFSRMSAVLSSDVMWIASTLQEWMRSLVKWYLIVMCFDRLWNWSSCANAIDRCLIVCPNRYCFDVENTEFIDKASNSELPLVKCNSAHSVQSLNRQTDLHSAMNTTQLQGNLQRAF